MLCLSNVAVTNNYYAELIRNGPAIHCIEIVSSLLKWTDAIDPLNVYRNTAEPSTPTMSSSGTGAFWRPSIY